MSLEPKKIDKFQKFATKAFEIMGDLGVPPIPRNYTIWYEYASGNNPLLKSRLDSIIAAKKTPSDEELEEVYQKHFSESRFLTAFSSAISDIVTALTERLTDSVRKMQEFDQGVSESRAILVAELPHLSSSPAVEKALNNLVSLADMATTESSEMSNTILMLNQELDSLSIELSMLQQQAATDGLTGLANRRAFDNTYHMMFEACRRDKVDLSVLMIDIDHFKQFNDTHGHQVGDLVLQYVAEQMRRCIKGRDFLARYGGEEFVILLPETDHRGARSVSETIRQVVGTQKLVVGRSRKDVGKVTLSVGATCLESTDSESSLLARADQFLLEAKKRGRDQVIVK